MAVLIIIACILVLAGIALVTFVGIRLRFSESEKTVAVSYILLGLMMDFSTDKGRLSVAGIPLFRFSLKRSKKKKRVEKQKKSEKAAEKPEKKPKGKKKKKRFRLSDLKMARNLIKGIKIRELAVKIRGGLAEPFYTGKMYGYYWAAKGMYPNLMSHVDFRPDFSAGTLTYDGRGLVYLRMFYIFSFVCRILFDRLKQTAKKLF